jgi:uncharacterized protein YlxW (UPF0749 family)
VTTATRFLLTFLVVLTAGTAAAQEQKPLPAAKLYERMGMLTDQVFSLQEELNKLKQENSDLKAKLSPAIAQQDNAANPPSEIK